MRALHIENLSKTYPNGVAALQNISLTIGNGMFGLLGSNGAGKSSLMRTIATLQQPDYGSLYFDSINILQDPLALRRVLGYLPQEFGVYPKESAESLLKYFAVLKGMLSPKERSHKIQEVLELTNLLDVKTKHVSDYSGGMKQRFGIAQLLLNDPELIIVDEPTAGLDPAERKRFLNLLREISRNTVVIFSTHLVDDVRDLCNNLAMINQGKVLISGSPKELIHEIEGKIWECSVSLDQKELMEEQYLVLSSAFTNDNKMAIRAYSPFQPSHNFLKTEATLEDAYFFALSKYTMEG
ncbi:MAG: ABC transporter ATP-binding protein [Balneola sp.]|nr:MAG: ABC transporter ATP-binding protein [Balneola sp.]